MGRCPIRIYSILLDRGGRKTEPVKVDDGLLSWGTLLVGGAQEDGDVDWDGADLGRRRVLFLV